MLPTGQRCQLATDDCDLARAVREGSTLTPSGRTGEEIAYQLLEDMAEITRRRPWITEGDAA